jgi:peptide/nickel transport system substrate-binding protein
MLGHSDSLKPAAYDLAAARRLLAEAGWPKGFRLVLHAPNDRYVNGEKVAQAVAQMLSRIGVQTAVVTMPASVFFTRANRLEFSMMMVGWTTDTGEVSASLKALLATYDRDKGWGAFNRGRYSNGRVDQLLANALATIDDTQREQLLEDATDAAMRDVGIIPLYHQMNIWATRKGILYTPRTDERTYAFGFQKD